MKKRSLYNLELSKDKTAVIVYRTDNNLGRQGVVLKDTKSPYGYSVRKEYTPYSVPQYILKECRTLLGIIPLHTKPIGTLFYYQGVQFKVLSFPNTYKVRGENCDVSIQKPKKVNVFISNVTFLD